MRIWFGPSSAPIATRRMVWALAAASCVVASYGTPASAAVTAYEAGYGFVHRVAVGTTSGIIESEGDEAVRSVSDSVSGPDSDGGTNIAAIRGDLRTGEIGLKAVGFPGNATGFVSLSETLTFDLRDRNADQNVDIRFGINLNGSVQDTVNSANVNIDLKTGKDRFTRDGIFASGGIGTFKNAGEGNFVPIADARFRPYTPQSVTGDWTALGPERFKGDLTMFGGGINEVAIKIVLGGSNGVDMLDTATLSLDTPIEFTSASGVFLDDGDLTVVPLPGAAYLFISGLAGLAVAARRNRAKAAAGPDASAARPPARACSSRGRWTRSSVS